MARVEAAREIEQLDFRGRGLTRISEAGLEQWPQLRVLLLSTNRIARMEGLEILSNLEKLDLSSNRISRIEGLSSLTRLRSLVLRNNQISRVDNLESLQSLELLDLSNNKIAGNLEGLSSLSRLSHLDLSHNSISTIIDLSHLSSLRSLSLFSNVISSLSSFINRLPTTIQSLNLAQNDVDSLFELKYLTSAVPNLKELDLSNNPCCTRYKFSLRPFVAFLLPLLTKLDGEPISTEDWELSRRLFADDAGMLSDQQLRLLMRGNEKQLVHYLKAIFISNGTPLSDTDDGTDGGGSSSAGAVLSGGNGNGQQNGINDLKTRKLESIQQSADLQVLAAVKSKYKYRIAQPNLKLQRRPPIPLFLKSDGEDSYGSGGERLSPRERDGVEDVRSGGSDVSLPSSPSGGAGPILHRKGLAPFPSDQALVSSNSGNSNNFWDAQSHVFDVLSNPPSPSKSSAQQSKPPKASKLVSRASSQAPISSPSPSSASAAAAAASKPSSRYSQQKGNGISAADGTFKRSSSAANLNVLGDDPSPSSASPSVSPTRRRGKVQQQQQHSNRGDGQEEEEEDSVVMRIASSPGFEGDVEEQNESATRKSWRRNGEQFRVYPLSDDSMQSHEEEAEPEEVARPPQKRVPSNSSSSLIPPVPSPIPARSSSSSSTFSTPSIVQLESPPLPSSSALLSPVIVEQSPPVLSPTPSAPGDDQISPVLSSPVMNSNSSNNTKESPKLNQQSSIAGHAKRGSISMEQQPFQSSSLSRKSSEFRNGFSSNRPPQASPSSTMRTSRSSRPSSAASTFISSATAAAVSVDMLGSSSGPISFEEYSRLRKQIRDMRHFFKAVLRQELRKREQATRVIQRAWRARQIRIMHNLKSFRAIRALGGRKPTASAASAASSAAAAAASAIPDPLLLSRVHALEEECNVLRMQLQEESKARVLHEEAIRFLWDEIQKLQARPPLAGIPASSIAISSVSNSPVHGQHQQQLRQTSDLSKQSAPVANLSNFSASPPHQSHPLTSISSPQPLVGARAVLAALMTGSEPRTPTRDEILALFHAAASLIQAEWRSVLYRRKYQRMRAAAIIIQRFVRNFLWMKEQRRLFEAQLRLAASKRHSFSAASAPRKPVVALAKGSPKVSIASAFKIHTPAPAPVPAPFPSSSSVLYPSKPVPVQTPSSSASYYPSASAPQPVPLILSPRSTMNGPRALAGPSSLSVDALESEIQFIESDISAFLNVFKESSTKKPQERGPGRPPF